MKSSAGAYKMLADLILISDKIVDFIVHKSDVQPTHQSKRIFKHLFDFGYIDKIDNNKFYITDSGKINMLNELVKKRKPDGKMRMIIFDIPEKLRARRNAFRKHLIDLDFNMEQQSVWVSELPCEDLVKLVIKHHNLKKYTSLIIGQLVR